MTIHDIAIVGGGPAGATAAIMMARAGARVALIDPGLARPRIEGLSPRVLRVMECQGLDATCVGPVMRRTTSWGALDQAPNREHCVERAAFDAGLRAQAGRAGVSIIGERAGRLAPGRVALPDGALRAGLVVEARGRAAPSVRARLRGPATVAICGWVESAGDGAVIEARPDGWLWRIAMPRPADGDGAGRADGAPCAGDAGRGWVQIVRDARDLAPGAAGLAAAWRVMSGGEAPRGLTARAAELRLNAADLDPNLPRIGDAAVAMDPLSGHGVFWALSSALAAAPMLRAILDGQPALARVFHRQRVGAQFWRQARIGRHFHRAAGFDTRFWRARAGWPDGDAGGAPEPAPACGAVLRRQVVVRDGRLVEAETVVTPRDPDGVAFVAGREIAPVLRRLGGGPLPPRAEFCARVLPEAPPAEAGLIHDWLCDRGIRSMPAAAREEAREVPA